PAAFADRLRGRPSRDTLDADPIAPEGRYDCSHHAPATGGRDLRHVLAGVRRLRQRGLRRDRADRRRRPARHRIPRRVTGVRADRADRRLRLRHRLGRPLQPGGDAGRRHRPPGGMEGAAALLGGAGEGGLLAGLLIFVIAEGREGFEATGNMAANGYGDHSPTGYSLWAVAIAEIVLTAVFLFVILGATEE